MNEVIVPGYEKAKPVYTSELDCKHSHPSTAAQTAIAGLVPFDVIIGAEHTADPSRPSIHKLILLWRGNQAAVFCVYRWVWNEDGSGYWRFQEESGNWTLGCRNWYRYNHDPARSAAAQDKP